MKKLYMIRLQNGNSVVLQADNERQAIEIIGLDSDGRAVAELSGDPWPGRAAHRDILDRRELGVAAIADHNLVADVHAVRAPDVDGGVACPGRGRQPGAGENLPEIPPGRTIRAPCRQSQACDTSHPARRLAEGYAQHCST